MMYFSKQPSEVVPLTLDFTKALPVGETLDPAATDVVLVYDLAGVDVTDDLIDDIVISSPYVSCTLLAEATSGTPPVTTGGVGTYRMHFLMPTNPGPYKIEADVQLKVKEPAA